MAFFDAPWWSPGPWTSRNFPPFCGATCPRTQHGCWRHRGKVHRDFGGILKNRGGEPISVGHRHPLHHDGHSRHHPRVREVSDTRCCGFGQTDSQRSLRHHLRNLALPVRHRYLCLGGRFSVSPPHGRRLGKRHHPPYFGGIGSLPIPCPLPDGSRCHRWHRWRSNRSPAPDASEQRHFYPRSDRLAPTSRATRRARRVPRYASSLCKFGE
ncbi:hypothetical protein DFH94DRAFT_72706 [Russula ochroleuca]|uniref:Uncharacterized protein n=1 Tax=Russula ochroleuca TaxID=152965 RepID=A0A9P5MSW2_9AGAM|nr:hypothetical protein DFH94DRAFT_72706 [Russula ochroleuca]